VALPTKEEGSVFFHGDFAKVEITVEISCDISGEL
jgi:hypothetical protein